MIFAESRYELPIKSAPGCTPVLPAGGPVRVLVTGATGFIGRHVVPLLLQRGHAVIALARDESKARGLSWFDQVAFVACDIRRSIDYPVSRFGQPQAVMHLAWSGLPNYQARFHLDENLPADKQFLGALLDGGAEQLLVTGTCLEYGMQTGSLSEATPSAPVTCYAQAKDELRQFLQALQLQRPFRLQWARLFYMYGEGQNPNSLIAQLDRAIAQRLPSFNMSGGEQLRDYLPVEQVARRLVALLESPDCDDIVNVCSGEPISVRSLVERHIAQVGGEIALKLGYYPYADYEPLAFWGSRDKWLRYFGEDNSSAVSDAHCAQARRLFTTPEGNVQ